MIITKEILNEDNISIMLKKLKKSFEKNEEYIRVIKEQAKSSNIEIQAINPFENERDFLLHWFKYGFVTGKDVIGTELCETTINKIKNKLSNLSIDLKDEKTWPQDDIGVPIMSRGFLDIYHDNLLAQIRQNKKLYLYHALLWQNIQLNTTFDRIGLKTRNTEGADGLSLHVDQNPNVHPDFRTIQGVVALSDCTENGTVVVPQSNKEFHKYADYIKEGYMGEYVELKNENTFYDKMQKTKIIMPLQRGSIISWDSRTTHGNITNTTQDRYVIYVSTGLEITNDEHKKQRARLFQDGEGANIRDAFCHASKSPRFNKNINYCREPEQLTLLGELLYGFKSYKEVI